mgnify:CR=1 FL=1
MSNKAYRDNNNFIRINQGDHNPERYTPFANGMPFKFQDITKGPVWIGKLWNETSTRSYDGGKNWIENDIKHKMFGAFFFLSEDIVAHSSNIYTFYDYLSDFGGIF